MESVGRIFDEHRRQDILMIQERDEFQRSINQEEDEDCIECVWMYDSNLNRELLKCVHAKQPFFLGFTYNMF